MSAREEELQQLTRAQLQDWQAKLHRIATEETDLRNRLAELDRAGRTGGGENDFGLRTVGGDLLWQAWVARQREGLQTRLANLMAHRVEVRERARVAFGRDQAAQGLCRLARVERLDKRRKVATERLLDTVIARWPDG